MYATFTIFGREVPYYGLLFIGGLLMGAFTAVPRRNKYGIERLDIVLAAVFAAIGGIIGAKLLSILTSIDYISQLISIALDPNYELTLLEAIVMIFQNGFVFYGGLIGGILGLFIYVKAYKLDVLKMFDIFAVSVPLGHAMGRVGCFISGCCYGIEYDGPLSFTYTHPYDPRTDVNPLGTPVGVPLLPVQLIEAACLLCLYVVLEILFRKTKRPGICLLVYAMCYCIIRFTLEFFRGDIVRGFLWGMSTSQWISMAIFVCAVALFIFLLVHDKKKKNAAQPEEGDKQPRVEDAAGDSSAQPRCDSAVQSAVPGGDGSEN